MRRVVKLLMTLLFLGLINISTFAQESGHDGTYRRLHVPILMYHYVSELPEDADALRRGLTVTPAQFAVQLNYLKQAGYETITFGQLEAALNRGAELPKKPIILSFDDGHIDHFEVVYPMLQAFDYVGTFFIVTGYIDAGLPGYINWEQVQIMARDGMDIQPHTKNHVDLRERTQDFLVYEIMGSRESILHYTDSDGIALSYPAGRYDAAVLAFLRTTDIRLAVTTEFGAWHTTSRPHRLSRLRVTDAMGAAGLAHLLQGAR